MNAPLNQATLVLTPLRNAAPAAGGTLEVLVRVQAPKRPLGADAPKRQPLRIAVVVDRSGSMSGEPLQEALRCTEYIAGGLHSSDQLSVVLYDNTVQVALPLAAAGNPAKVRAALAGVESGGNTALFSGWEAGAKCLKAPFRIPPHGCCCCRTARRTKACATRSRSRSIARAGPPAG
jgi:Ca-activated chloride channel homolog